MLFWIGVEVAIVYHLPSPMITTIVEDGTIHEIFEYVAEGNVVVTVKESDISINREEQTVKEEKVQGDNTSCEAGTSSATQDQVEKVNAEAKPNVPTTQSCTNINVN